MFYRTGLPYFEILLLVDEVLQGRLELETAEIVLTQVGYSPLDEANPLVGLTKGLTPNSLAWGQYPGTKFEHL